MFDPSDKEAASLTQRIQASVIVVTAVHDVKGSRFGQQQIEHIDLVQFAADGSANALLLGESPELLEVVQEFRTGR